MKHIDKLNELFTRYGQPVDESRVLLNQTLYSSLYKYEGLGDRVPGVKDILKQLIVDQDGFYQGGKLTYANISYTFAVLKNGVYGSLDLYLTVGTIPKRELTDVLFPAIARTFLDACDDLARKPGELIAHVHTIYDDPINKLSGGVRVSTNGEAVDVIAKAAAELITAKQPFPTYVYMESEGRCDEMRIAIAKKVFEGPWTITLDQAKKLLKLSTFPPVHFRVMPDPAHYAIGKIKDILPDLTRHANFLLLTPLVGEHTESIGRRLANTRGLHRDLEKVAMHECDGAVVWTEGTELYRDVPLQPHCLDRNDTLNIELTSSLSSTEAVKKMDSIIDAFSEGVEANPVTLTNIELLTLATADEGFFWRQPDGLYTQVLVRDVYPIWFPQAEQLLARLNSEYIAKSKTTKLIEL